MDLMFNFLLKLLSFDRAIPPLIWYAIGKFVKYMKRLCQDTKSNFHCSFNLALTRMSYFFFYMSVIGICFLKNVCNATRSKVCVKFLRVC